MFECIELVHHIDQIAQTVQPKKKYLILCAENFPFEDIATSIEADWMGALFPAIFNQNGIDKKSAYVCTLKKDAKLIWFTQNCLQKCTDLNSYLMIVSGKDPNVGQRLESLFEFTPSRSVVFGGGAGALERTLDACLFNGEKYHEDGAILVASSSEFSTSAHHGYKSMGDYSIVTSAHGNWIEEIDFRPAFEMYQDAIKRHTGIEVGAENLFETGLKHPLIFERAFGENTVRNPISTDGRSMMMVGSIAEDTVISLGAITQEELIDASVTCAKALHVNTNNTKAIIFDCVGRSKVLGENFNGEIQGIMKQLQQKEIVGVLSLGEIANAAKNYVEFYNSTCVIGVPHAV